MQRQTLSGNLSSFNVSYEVGISIVVKPTVIPQFIQGVTRRLEDQVFMVASNGDFELSIPRGAKVRLLVVAGSVVKHDVQLHITDTATASIGAYLTLPTAQELHGLGLQDVDTYFESSAFVAQSNRVYLCDTTAAGFTVTLPQFPALGDKIELWDIKGKWGTGHLTVSGNRSRIGGTGADFVCDTANAKIELMYYNAEFGWQLAVEQITTISGGGSGSGGSGSGTVIYELDTALTGPTNFYVAGSNGEEVIQVKGAGCAFIYLPNFGDVVNGITLTQANMTNKNMRIVARRSTQAAIVLGGNTAGDHPFLRDLHTINAAITAPNGGFQGYYLNAYKQVAFSQVADPASSGTRWALADLPSLVKKGYNTFPTDTPATQGDCYILNAGEYDLFNAMIASMRVRKSDLITDLQGVIQAEYEPIDPALSISANVVRTNPNTDTLTMTNVLTHKLRVSRNDLSSGTYVLDMTSAVTPSKSPLVAITRLEAGVLTPLTGVTLSITLSGTGAVYTFSGLPTPTLYELFFTLSW